MSLPLCPCEAPWTPEYRESYPRLLDPDHDDLPEDDDSDDYSIPEDDQTRLG